MSAGSYLAGWAAILTVVAALGWGAWWFRRALLPEWSGPPARLAEVVIALAVPIGLAQLLGSFGALRRGPMLIGCVGIGLATGFAARRAAGSRAVPAPPPVPPVRREEAVVAVAATALVTAQWATHVAVTLGRGMTQPDTLWYHAPYAARFVQTGRLTRWSDTGLSDLATPLHSYITLNGSLVHGLAMLPFDRDILSPLLNLGWFALALLAGWCIGRRQGVAALCLLGTVVVLGLPALAGTQPGQAANDIGTAALFLTAVALVFEGDLAPRPTTLAAVAAGLALGTKLSVAVPVAVLTVGVVVVALRARRPLVAALWCGALAVSGGYWFLRNWIVAGNPLPWADIDLGPFSLDAAFETRPNLVPYLDQSETWRRFIFPGLSEAYGRTWPVLLALAFGGAALAIVRGRRPLERFAGAAVFLVFVYHPFIPFMGDLGGGVFVFTLRYLTPVLMLGLALLSLQLDDARVVARRAAWITMAGLVVAGAAASHHERIPAWPQGELGVALVAGAVVLGAAALLAFVPVPRDRRMVGLAAAVLAAVVVGAVWVAQDRYLDRRYVRAGLPLDGANSVFRNVSDERVAVFGTEELYPMFGLDVSNRASKVRGPNGGSATRQCREWRRILTDGGYGYVVLGHEPLTDLGPAPEWVGLDSATTQVARDGAAVVYRVDGPLDPDGCP